MERWNQSIKSECIGPGLPLSLHTAKHPIAWSVAVYNEQRLHSSLGYVTPKDMLEGCRWRRKRAPVWRSRGSQV